MVDKETRIIKYRAMKSQGCWIRFIVILEKQKSYMMSAIELTRHIMMSCSQMRKLEYTTDTH